LISERSIDKNPEGVLKNQAKTICKEDFLLKRQFRILAALCAVGSLPLVADEIAEATYSVTQVSPTTWSYAFTLTDAGTTPIGTFWFSWLPGEGFMQTAPLSAVAPTGWVDTNTNGTAAGDGFSERWVDNAGALMPGDSLSGFSFVSMTTPSEIAGASPFHNGTPELTSDVYMGAPLVGADAPFVVTAATPVATPEPSSVVLILAGIALLIVKSCWSLRLRPR
jgi:hypothetical protein